MDIKRDDLIRMLQTIYRCDKTRYDHHEKRTWDGKLPEDEGGTIWLTPREMAGQALRFLGADIPDAIKDLRSSNR